MISQNGTELTEMCLLLLLVPATGRCHIVDGVDEGMREQKGWKGVTEGESVVVGKGMIGRCCQRCEGGQVLSKTESALVDPMDKQRAMFIVYLQMINNNIYKGT
jgi:hypothetical protein